VGEIITTIKICNNQFAGWDEKGYLNAQIMFRTMYHAYSSTITKGKGISIDLEEDDESE